MEAKKVTTSYQPPSDGGMAKEEFIREMKASFKHKFAKKPEVIDGNMKALEMAYNSVEYSAVMSKSA